MANSTRAVAWSGRKRGEFEKESIYAIVYMDDLRVGDHVLGRNNKHSRVYSMSHIDRNAEMKYIQLHSSKSPIPLKVSDDHFVFLNSNQEVKRAADVKIGDTLQNEAVVTDIQTVKRRGLYAPLTMSGELLVSGDFLASSFVSMSNAIPAAVQHHSAHTVMAPLRWVCSTSFEVCENESHTLGRSDFVWAGIQALWKVTALLSPFPLRNETIRSMRCFP